jgi:sodium-coupled neutral amino acid transporter 11
MMVILITVVTQGFTVPAESRGTFGLRLLTINDGVFQAIGVISFGMNELDIPTTIQAKFQF